MDLARLWIQDLSGNKQSPESSLRLEAALLEAQGDLHGAASRVDQLQAHIEKESDPRTRELGLRILDRWREEVGANRAVGFES